MRSLYVASYVLLWVLVVALVAMVLLLYRQFGLMLIPGSRRADLAGLDIGAKAPPLAVEFRNGRPPLLTWDRSGLAPGQRGWVAVFASPRCPICEGLWESAALETAASSSSDVEFLWIDSRWRSSRTPLGWTLAIGEGDLASKAMDVPVFPFAYAIGLDGRVLAKRLINEPEHVELLVEEAFGRADKHPDTSAVEVESSNGGTRQGVGP